MGIASFDLFDYGALVSSNLTNPKNDIERRGVKNLLFNL
jgi:hypothetical protein